MKAVMSDSLDAFYQKELDFFRSSVGEFSNRFPKIANRLTLSASGVKDPHVERLIQAFAYLNARTRLKLDDSFAARYVNEGFSGGEKKRLEMLQMAILQPEFAILDETDSGLDIDALRIVAEGVNAQLSPELGVLLITHYQRLLDYIKPDVVHVLARGRIVKTGGSELALQLEQEGYAPILRAAGYQDIVADATPAVEPDER